MPLGIWQPIFAKKCPGSDRGWHLQKSFLAKILVVRTNWVGPTEAGLSYGIRIVVVGQKLLELWSSKNWNMWFSAVFRGLSRRNVFLGAGKNGFPMTQSRPQLSYGIGFMVVGCVVSESISAQNKKKSVTDRRTDRQVQNYIPSLRALLIACHYKA